MSIGFTWTPVLKFTPDNGSVSTMTLDNTTFSDGIGPVETRLRYDIEQEQDETVTRKLRQVLFGFRPKVDFSFDIANQTDHANLATIIDKFMHTGVKVSLALDGLNGVFREVVLDEAPAPEPFNRKSVAGARYRMKVVCVDVIDSIPAMNTGTW